MKAPYDHVLHLFMLAVLLCACEYEARPFPTNTLIPPTPTNTPASRPSPLPPIAAQTSTPFKPSSTPGPVRHYTPANTLVVSPTPLPGWKTYTNEYLGYSFNYPAEGKILVYGFGGMDVNELLPPGFTFDEYFDYVMAILPDNLCVIVQIPGASIAISPPYDPIGSFVSPCPGMGIGSQYRMEAASETWTIAGREVKDSQGTKLILKSDNSFYGEFHVFNLENGFRVVFNGGPHGEISSASYPVQGNVAREILSTLHWLRVPDLTKPGTTCAGKFTRLVAWTKAVVTGDPGDPPDRVRSGPGSSYEVIYQIYPRMLVTVVEGPVCVDGLVFWKVENALIPGSFGWTAEGDGTEYWLEPFKP
jgi:hypothetical protein